MGNDNTELEATILRLFARFQVIYGHKWVSQLPPDDLAMLRLALAEWGAGLRGLSAAQLEHAVARARRECDWPPSIAEFVRLALDVPSFAEVAHHGDLKRLGPVGARIASRIDGWNLGRMSAREARDYLRSFYAEAVDHVTATRLEVLPAATREPLLPAEVACPEPAEVA